MFSFSMTSQRNVLVTLALCATLLCLTPTTTNAYNRKLSRRSTEQLQKIPAKKMPLYVFGDSLYDTGTGLYGKKGPAAEYYPYGETRFATPHGRFSNGYLIPDFIADYAGLDCPEPYLRDGFSNYTEAVNFADAAAGILVETRPNTLNLKLQVENFGEMVGKLKQQYGETETKKVLSRALFLFNIGANDYVDLYNLNNKNVSASKLNLRQTEVMGNFSSHIHTIYNYGGRKFAFHYAAPMGCLPAFLTSDGACSEDLNAMATMYNEGIKLLAREKSHQLDGFKYSLYDFFNSLLKRKANGSKYGFKETRSACCGSGQYHRDFSCGDKNRSKFNVCSDPSDYLWFDAGHPTEKADQQFATEFWSGGFDVVRPRNIMSLYKTDNVALRHTCIKA